MTNTEQDLCVLVKEGDIEAAEEAATLAILRNDLQSWCEARACGACGARGAFFHHELQTIRSLRNSCTLHTKGLGMSLVSKYLMAALVLLLVVLLVWYTWLGPVVLVGLVLLRITGKPPAAPTDYRYYIRVYTASMDLKWRFTNLHMAVHQARALRKVYQKASLVVRDKKRPHWLLTIEAEKPRELVCHTPPCITSDVI